MTWSGFQSGDSVAVFGAGPVGLLAAYSATIRGASKVYIVDHVQARLDLAASFGAIPIDFRASNPVDQILAREPNGVRRTVDCVGYEAENATSTVVADIVLEQMSRLTAPRGGMGIVGLYNPGLAELDYGVAFGKTVQVNGGVVLPLELAGEIVPLIREGRAKTSFIFSAVIGIEEAPEYYARFDRREESKVVTQF